MPSPAGLADKIAEGFTAATGVAVDTFQGTTGEILARYRAFDIIFMIPFMTPPYIASMGWILFMQKRGLLQQLLPFTAGSEKAFFTFGGLTLVMSLHVFPFMLTILKNAMLNIPSSLEEAGAVFGAGFGRRSRRTRQKLLFCHIGKHILSR